MNVIGYDLEAVIRVINLVVAITVDGPSYKGVSFFRSCRRSYNYCGAGAVKVSVCRNASCSVCACSIDNLYLTWITPLSDEVDVSVGLSESVWICAVAAVIYEPSYQFEAIS